MLTLKSRTAFRRMAIVILCSVSLMAVTAAPSLSGTATQQAQAHSAPVSAATRDTVLLFRLKNTVNGDNFYTTNPVEAQIVVAKYNYQYVGIAARVYTHYVAGTVKV
jgi:hypothetical protein